MSIKNLKNCKKPLLCMCATASIAFSLFGAPVSSFADNAAGYPDEPSYENLNAGQEAGYPKSIDMGESLTNGDQAAAYPSNPIADILGAFGFVQTSGDESDSDDMSSDYDSSMKVVSDESAVPGYPQTKSSAKGALHGIDENAIYDGVPSEISESMNAKADEFASFEKSNDESSDKALKAGDANTAKAEEVSVSSLETASIENASVQAENASIDTVSTSVDSQDDSSKLAQTGDLTFPAVCGLALISVLAGFGLIKTRKSSNR